MHLVHTATVHMRSGSGVDVIAASQPVLPAWLPRKPRPRAFLAPNLHHPSRLRRRIVPGWRDRVLRLGSVSGIGGKS